MIGSQMSSTLSSGMDDLEEGEDHSTFSSWMDDLEEGEDVSEGDILLLVAK